MSATTMNMQRERTQEIEGTVDTEPVPTTKHQRTETTYTQPKRWVHNHATKQRS